MKTAAAVVTSKDVSKMSKEAQAKIQAQADIKADIKAPAKPEPVAKAPKPKPAYLLYLMHLIEEGTFTQKELTAAAWHEFPEVSKSTIETVLVDSKNPKYNRFPTLVVKDEKGLLGFTKAS